MMITPDTLEAARSMNVAESRIPNNAAWMTDAARCSKGWGDRCAHGRSARCRCACGGANHGRANPASAIHEVNRRKARQTDMFNQLDMRTDRKALEYQLGEPPTRVTDLPTNDGRVIVFARVGNDEPQIGIQNAGSLSISPLPHTIVYHSPTGLEFGYGGSGPADTALNILALVLTPKEAVRLHQRFKFSFVASVPRAGGMIPMSDVVAWIAARYLEETSNPLTMAEEAESRRMFADMQADMANDERVDESAGDAPATGERAG